MNYFDDLTEVAGRAHDDIEFLFGALFAGRKNIARHGIPMVFPREQPLSKALFLGRAESPKPYAISGDLEIEAVTLRIDAFVDDGLVDESFKQALATKPKALILDLRTCSGVELASLRAAAWLIDSPLNAGTFVGAGRSESSAGSGALEVQLGPGTSTSALSDQLGRDKALAIEVLPREERFSGVLVVLTSRRTSSTAEALVAALAAAGRATVIGEPTAGRPLLSREFDLGQGWSMRIAAYDYLKPDGTRVGRSGVEPTVRVGKDDAPKAARAWLLQKLGPRPAAQTEKP